MNSEGCWAFAPAYDLTYTSNGYHQMLLGSKVLSRATFEDLKNAFKPYNIDKSFLKENIEKMIEIKNTKLVNECVNLNIPKEFAIQILDVTKTVDENFSIGINL
jgi:serine/threonine-protein kinase HipA